MSVAKESNRRRTFAIISHPDAGKTTLTEKLLLYGGAVQLAGSVTANRNRRATTSDWMELERQRGISVSSTVLQFEYGDCCINLLDTPGHNDFSEDTYRVLMAVDSVVMVIDAGKGIESQTRKLFEVCRFRGIPIFTFMNKCDRPTLEPLALLDDLERTLQIRTTAVNWPLGNGPGFRGVYDRINREVNLYERVKGGAYRAPVSVHGLDDETVKESLDEETLAKVRHELELLDGAGEPFDLAAVRKGDMTPVFFGSAANNFGVQFLLDAFVASAPPPGPRMSKAGLIPPDHPSFSGFIFKIQSNMDPRHRDRIAFLRICSGKFVRDMQVVHSESGETVRLSSSHKVLGRERESITEAFPGDVIGLVGHSRFGVGDTLSEDPAIVYPELPRFAPECFAFVHRASTDQDKRFRKGIEDLLKEGLAQVFTLSDSQPLLGAVGPLQFEVLQYRLKAEYGAASRIESKPWKVIRWISPETQADFEAASIPNGMKTARDEKGESVLLSDTEWDMKYFADRNPKVRLTTTGSAIAKATEAPARWPGVQSGKTANPLAKWNSESLG